MLSSEHSIKARLLNLYFVKATFQGLKAMHFEPSLTIYSGSWEPFFIRVIYLAVSCVDTSVSSLQNEGV